MSDTVTTKPPRPPQVVRGGYVLLRRHRETGELRMRNGHPYEHGDREDAEAQARVLAERLGAEIAVFQVVASILPPPPPVESAVQAEPARDPEPISAEPMPKASVIVERRARRVPKVGVPGVGDGKRAGTSI